MTPDEPEYSEYHFTGCVSDDEDMDDAAGMAMSEAERRSLREQLSGIHETEGLNYLEALRTPYTADDLIEMINDCAFFESTKETLRGLIRGTISTGKLLSNTPSIEEAQMKFDILLLELTATVPTHDTDSPQWLTTIGILRDVETDIIYRTFGAYRERRLQDVNRMEVVTGKLGTAPQKPQDKPQKRGIRFL